MCYVLVHLINTCTATAIVSNTFRTKTFCSFHTQKHRQKHTHLARSHTPNPCLQVSWADEQHVKYSLEKSHTEEQARLVPHHHQSLSSLKMKRRKTQNLHSVKKNKKKNTKMGMCLVPQGLTKTADGVSDSTDGRSTADLRRYQLKDACSLRSFFLLDYAAWNFKMSLAF